MDAAPPPNDADRALAARQLDALDQLLEVGMKLVRGIGAQADTAAQEDPGGRLSDGRRELRYERLARSVRLTIGLQRRIAEAQPLAAHTMAQNRDRLAERRRRVADEVARAAEADGGPALPERQVECALDRERPEDILSRPIEEVVAVICRGLGLAPDWDRWTADDAAARDIFAASPPDEPRPAAPAAGPPAARRPHHPLPERSALPLPRPLPAWAAGCAPRAASP